MNWRARIKTVLARHFLLIEFCHRCGRKQPLVWHAPNEIWERFCGAYSILCPECITHNADKGGTLLYWTVGYSFHFRKMCRASAATGGEDGKEGK